MRVSVRTSAWENEVMREMDVSDDFLMEGASVLRCLACGAPRSFMSLECDCGRDVMTWVPSGCLLVVG